MVKIKSLVVSIPLLAVVVTAIIAVVQLSFGNITETFAIIMILTLLSAFILDQAIENISFKEKVQDVIDTVEKNKDITNSIHCELIREKVPCELVDPCIQHLWEFEKDLLWFNAPMILAEDEIFETIKHVYSQTTFNKAKYIFYKGGTKDDKQDFQKRIKRYDNVKNRMSGTKMELGKKMKAKIIDDIPPRYSFFIGKKGGIEECILYIMETPFAIDAKKGEEPGYVFTIRDTNLIRRLRTIFNNEWVKGDVYE
jgi:hypothetical protein